MSSGAQITRHPADAIQHTVHVELQFHLMPSPVFTKASTKGQSDCLAMGDDAAATARATVKNGAVRIRWYYSWTKSPKVFRKFSLIGLVHNLDSLLRKSQNKVRTFKLYETCDY